MFFAFNDGGHGNNKSIFAVTTRKIQIERLVLCLHFAILNNCSKIQSKVNKSFWDKISQPPNFFFEKKTTSKFR